MRIFTHPPMLVTRTIFKCVVWKNLKEEKKQLLSQLSQDYFVILKSKTVLKNAKYIE